MLWLGYGYLHANILWKTDRYRDEKALVQRLDAQFIFTAAQKEKLQPLCLELGAKMDAAAKRPAQRREIFEQYAPRIRAQLTTNQLAAYDQMVAEQRARHARQRP